MIQAVENNYEVPRAYLDHEDNQHTEVQRVDSEKKVRRCSICDDKGFRYVRSLQYPTGAMRQCTHDSKIEARYENPNSQPQKATPSDAQNSPIRDETLINEKGPAEDSASP